MKRRDFSHIRSHRFRDRRYGISWKRPKDQTKCAHCGQKTERNPTHGECDPPRNPAKLIQINPNLPELDLLETVIHEGIHGCLWDVEEEAVGESARDIALIVWRMGFRLD